MAKMGFSPQTTPFRPSSLLPPYLWFCRSCTSPSRAFCRLEGRANHRENGLNANLLELNRRKSYATFQHYESEIYHAPKSHFPYSPLKKPSVRIDMEKREELSVEVLNGNFRPLHTAEDWGKATEECKNNKKRYAYSTTVSANLKTLPKEDVAERVERGNRKKYEGKDSGLSRMNNDNPIMKVARPNGLENKGYRDSITNKNNVFDEKESASASGNLKTLPEEDVAERVERGSRKKYDRKSSGLSRMNNNNPIMKVARPNGLENKGYQDFITNKNNVFDEKESASASANLKTLPEEDVAKRVERGSRKKYERKGSGVSRMNNDNPVMKVARPNGLENKGYRDSITDKNNVFDEKESASASADLKTLPEEDVAERVERGSRKKYERKGSGVSRVNNDNPIMKVAHSNDLENKGYRDSITDKNNVLDEKEAASAYKKSDLTDSVSVTLGEKITSSGSTDLHKRLSQVYDKVLVVNSISAAREVVKLLTTEYRNFVHACDTEVASIDVKEETPVDHGEVICFSIYSGAQADFGYGKSCVWVDVLDGGGKNLIREFAPFFEDPTIKKVWHNYSFDNHVIENYGLKLSGFYADTMHMARLWNSARRTEGGYSLEALTRDPAVMSDAKGGGPGQTVTGKVSMKNIFGRKKKKKNGSDGKITIIPPVEELQRDDRILWICYSALDSISTLRLYESLEKKLMKIPWCVDGKYEGSMFDNYQIHLRPFGELLVKMEAEGMLVDRSYLAEIEKVAKAEQQLSADRFRRWASKYCPDAKYMNVGSDTQLRQIFFGGIQNRKDPNEFLPVEKEFKVPNVDNIIEEGKKSPTKFRKFVLRKPDFVNIETDKYTAGGWPSVSGDVLKNLAGKVSADFDFADEENDEQLPENMSRNTSVETDITAYGVAYSAFGGGQTGIEACHAIAALCEGCSIDSLISNFIIPLQGNHISGKNGRIHCSLNINTETGRLSARRPNLQNQPALEKDRYKIRQAFIAAPGNSLIVADYGQLELRILAHLANCKSMLDAFKAGGDFHSRTAMNMYPHIRAAVERKDVLLEWHPQSGEDKPPVPLLKDAFASERRKAKMLNFSIAYGKTTVGLARDWKVSREEAQETVNLWYSDRQEVLAWQEERKKQANSYQLVYTLLGRARHFPSLKNASPAHKNHIERAAINTPVQGSAADVAMCAMLEISRNARLKELGWRLLLQVHDEVILEGPTESGEEAKAIVVDCMSKPFDGKNILRVGLSVDAKCAQNWYAAK